MAFRGCMVGVFLSSTSFKAANLVEEVNLRWQPLAKMGDSACGEVAVVTMETAQLFAGENNAEMPSDEGVRGNQGLIAEGGAAVVDTSFRPVIRRTATLDGETLRRNKRVLWIPDEEGSMHKRLLVCTHIQEPGHRGVTAKSACLFGYCS